MFHVRSKKGDIQSQLFTYILTVVIIGLLLFFSIKWLGGLMSMDKSMDITRFKSSLESEFERIAPNYGSYEYSKFQIPSSITKVCFLDITKQPSGSLCGDNHPENHAICDAWGDKVSNVAFDPPIETEVKLPNLIIDGQGFVCVTPNDGYITLKIEGRGNKVRVSQG